MRTHSCLGLSRTLVCALALLTLLYVCAAVADGMKFPPRYVKDLPKIPKQRALIVFRDATERLTIESTFEGQGDEFGWIMPVPATPTAVEEGSAGFMRTLSSVLQPEIIPIHSLALAFLGAAVSVWAVLVLMLRPRSRAKACLLFLAPGAILVVSVFCVALDRARFSPGFTLGAGGADRVEVELAAQVGGYDVHALKAEDVGALNAWLDENGFVTLPEEGVAIVEEYIREGWRFVVAKLRADDEGPRRTFPLTIVFPAQRPIYPMRLTALAKSDVYLELLVIADERAGSELLDLEVADRFIESEARGGVFAGWMPHRAMVSATRHSYVHRIGHPRAFEQMWERCMVTKLIGTLRPGQMARDIPVTLEAAPAYQATYWTYEAARNRAWSWAGAVWSGGFALGLMVLYGRIRASGGRWFAVRFILVPVWFAGALVGGSRYLPTDTTSTTPQYRTYWNMHGALQGYVEEVLCKANDSPFFTGGPLAPWLREKLSEAVASYGNTPPFREGDGPFEFALVEERGDVILRFFTEDGSPYDINVSELGPFWTIVIDGGDSHVAGDIQIWDRNHPRLQTHYSWLFSVPERLVKQTEDEVNADLNWFCWRHNPSALQSGQLDPAAVPEILGRLRKAEDVYEKGNWRQGGFHLVRSECLDGLELLSGLRFSLASVDEMVWPRWNAWWEAHKGQSRAQWLREAFRQRTSEEDGPIRRFIAIELLRLGDDTGLPFLLKDLEINVEEAHKRLRSAQVVDTEPELTDALVSALLMARLGRAEAYPFLARLVALPELRWRSPIGRRSLRMSFATLVGVNLTAALAELADPSATDVLLQAWANWGGPSSVVTRVSKILRRALDKPAQYAPVFLKHLQAITPETIDANRDRYLFMLVRSLGMMTQTRPPKDLNDDDALKAFVASVKAWCDKTRQA